MSWVRRMWFALPGLSRILVSKELVGAMRLRCWLGAGVVIVCVLGLRGHGDPAYAILEWSSTIARSEGDLLALRALLSDPEASRSLRSILPTQELLQLQTTSMLPGDSGSCATGNDGTVAGRWLQIAFRYPYIAASRAYFELYEVCLPPGGPPLVTLREQGFTTSLEQPPTWRADAAVARTPEELKALQLALDKQEVQAALVTTLQERPLAFVRIRGTGSEGGLRYLELEAGDERPAPGQDAPIRFEVELDPLQETVRVFRIP